MSEVVDEITEAALEGIQALEGATAPEPEAEAPDVEATPEPAPEPLLAGKFKTPEDLGKGYEELQAVLDRQGSELGELRKLQDQVQALEQRQSAPQINQDTIDWFDEQVEQNPYAAANWARQNDPSGVLYDRAMDQWYEINPRHAGAYERHMEQQQFLAQLQGQLEPALRPLLQQKEANDFQQAMVDVARRFPDFDRVSGQIMEAAESAPEVLSALQEGDLASKTRVIENLYWMARGRAATSLAEAAQGAATSAAVQTQAAKMAAQIASPSVTNPPTDDDNLSAGDRWLRDLGFDDAIKQYQG